MKEEKKQQIILGLHSKSLRVFIWRDLYCNEISITDANISACKEKISRFEEILNSSPSIFEITVWSDFLTAAIVLDTLGWEFKEDYTLPKHLTEFYEKGTNTSVFFKGSKIAILGSMKTDPNFETSHNTALSLFSSSDLL